MHCQLSSGSSLADTAERCTVWLLGDWLGGSLGGWLACLLETCEIWFTLRACCSKPQPTVCIFPHCLWQLVVPAPGWGWWWGAPSRHPTLHFSGCAQGQEHIWLTGRFVCGVSFLSFRFHNLHTQKHTHTHTHTHIHARTFCELTCCCAAGVCVHKQKNPAHRCTPTQTNKHTCCSWQVALTISRRREGKQNKQFNLHDSSLLYISMPWQW